MKPAATYGINDPAYIVIHQSLAEKRAQYKCGPLFLTPDMLRPWSQHDFMSMTGLRSVKHRLDSPFRCRPDLNARVSVWRGDITSLEVDAIVNAANKSLRGGGGVDGAIHRAAGSLLDRECAELNGCEVGDAKLTHGYRLPAKFVIHTVGPKGQHEAPLRAAYANSLQRMVEHQLTTIAFPCISTGVYGFPNAPACKIALETVRNFLEHDAYGPRVERVIFCLFMAVDIDLYERFAHYYFPWTAVDVPDAESASTVKIADEPEHLLQALEDLNVPMEDNA